MPAVAPYIPTKQSMFSAWLANFSSLISANPSSYGLMASDATTIAGYNTSWIAAYTPVTMASTKTPAAIAAKNTEYAMILPQRKTTAGGEQRRRVVREQDCPGFEPENEHAGENHRAKLEPCADDSESEHGLDHPSLSRFGRERECEGETLWRDRLRDPRDGRDGPACEPGDDADPRERDERAPTSFRPPG